jgi:hypothetical protein
MGSNQLERDLGIQLRGKYKMRHLLYYFKLLTIVSLMVTCAHAYDMTLAWDPNSESDIVGYNLYVRVNDSDTYNLVDDINLNDIDSQNPEFLITDMESDVTYDFAVTALNNAGLESHFSNEVSVLNGQAIAPISVAQGDGIGSGGGGCFIRASDL